MADYRDRDDSWRDSVAPGIPGVQPVSVNPSDNSIVPAPDTSGLYAIYGRKNPYSARASRLGAMAGMDMGGRLGQLPGIVATLMAGRAEKKSEEFEKQKDADIKSFMERKEKWDQIKADREASKQMFDESTKIMGIAGDKFNQVLQETNGDFDRASKDTDAWLSEIAKQQGIPLPMVKGYARFKNSKVNMAVSKDGKEWLPIQLDEKTGVALAWDKAKESWGKIPEGYALLSDFAKLESAQAKSRPPQPKPMSPKDYAAALTSQINNLTRITKDRALTIEEQRQFEAAQAELNKITGVKPPKPTYWEPGTNPPPEAFKKAQGAAPRPTAQPQAPATAPATPPQVSTGTVNQPPTDAAKRAEAIRILEGQKQKLSEANIAYVMGQL